MSSGMTKTCLAVLFGVVLTATGLWASAAAEEEPAAAMEKEMVMDPATGKQVTAPEYGGTLTVPIPDDPPTVDTYYGTGGVIAGLVVEKLGIGDWGVDRDTFDFRTTYLPDHVIVGRLAERWEQPDPTTIIFHIREGVNWHDKAPMNGRALTAKDVEFNFHRYVGIGSGFTEVPEAVARSSTLDDLGITSVTAQGNTVVFKLAEVNLDALKNILTVNVAFIYPPEVIRAGTGIDIGDWQNLVGTGPYELTDWVEGSSVNWEKAPDYWGFDEKFPQNRLPYIDSINMLVMPESQTRLAALRSGKLDFVGFQTNAQVTSIDQLESLQRTNPDIVGEGYNYRSETSPVINMSRPPFDDVRVRHALQMALDVEGAGGTYFKGYAVTQPQGWLGRNLYPYMNRYEDWPADLKRFYSYDPAGAEELLDEAGLPRGADGTRFELELTALPTLGDAGWNEIIADSWRQIGIDVTLTVQEGPVFTAKRNECDFDVQMLIGGYEWNPTGQLLHHVTDGGFNPGCQGSAGNSDPVYDAMVERVQAATSLEERQALSRDASDYLNRQHFALWGARVPSFNVFWPWVKGYNGEADPGDADRILIYSRVWIDQDLKREMGF